MHHRLIVVFGLPGSGKTTIAQKIYESLGKEISIMLRTDKIRKELFPRPIYSQTEAEETFTEMFLRARRALKDGKTVILDGVFAKEYEREECQRIADRVGCNCQYIYVFANEDVIEERLFKNSSLDDSEVDFQVYLKLKRLFDPIHEKVLKIDNSFGVEKLDRSVEMIVT